MMIEDFGGKARGVNATSDINYVVVPKRPYGKADRVHYGKQLLEADLLELHVVSVDQVMRRIGGQTANTNGPYRAGGDVEEEDADMDDGEEGSRPPTLPARRRTDGRKADSKGPYTAKGEEEEDEADNMCEGEKGSKKE